MDGFLTVGQSAAVAAVRAMLRSRVPHALALVGPASVGKHALALDLAAALLCTGARGDARPCRACRGCRLVEHGNHPDLHVLGPEGTGGQVIIGGKDGKRGVRDLVTELALLPAEGGERVAIVREAHRMNEDAQSAILKTLEEPPPATTLILCADDEEQLLPTIRSRCARVRLGTVGTRDIEQLLAGRDLADPPAAARLARLSGGRPGIAVAYASAPDAELIRLEIARTLLDLAGRRRADGLVAARDLLARALALATLLEPHPAGIVEQQRRRGRGKAAAGPPVAAEGSDLAGGASGSPADEEGSPKVTAAERRKALGLLLDVWRGLVRDIACVQSGALRSARETALLEELEATARGLRPAAVAAALARIVRAGELLDVNATPELVLDVLLVRWAAGGHRA